ncbi:predicted protein [Botrytis cinerea T4]|uniref:Uncharacterized protein n=1 Tax=Botryotinia fuckeliana (strain T4) TaxID=999810 RepID=G2XYW6_BOTF4|nr:predicted protein [Botrytis cinerea T4]
MINSSIKSLSCSNRGGIRIKVSGCFLLKNRLSLAVTFQEFQSPLKKAASKVHP